MYTWVLEQLQSFWRYSTSGQWHVRSKTDWSSMFTWRQKSMVLQQKSIENILNVTFITNQSLTGRERDGQLRSKDWSTLTWGNTLENHAAGAGLVSTSGVQHMTWWRQEMFPVEYIRSADRSCIASRETQHLNFIPSLFQCRTEAWKLIKRNIDTKNMMIMK